jgi:LAS superfamily LD-carboxypeptidase LdcB
MPSPLIFFVVVVVIDLILKSIKDKKKIEEKRQKDITQTATQTQTQQKKSNNTIRELRKSIEEEFERQKDKMENINPRNVSNEAQERPRREGRERKTRQELIEKQREKINKHSEMDNSKRLQRESTMSKSRLSDSQIPLGQKDSKRKSRYDDLENRRPVTIEVENTSRENKKSGVSGMVNIEKDILKGIIFSEILSKPKSISK